VYLRGYGSSWRMLTTSALVASSSTLTSFTCSNRSPGSTVKFLGNTRGTHELGALVGEDGGNFGGYNHLHCTQVRLIQTCRSVMTKLNGILLVHLAGAPQENSTSYTIPEDLSTSMWLRSVRSAASCLSFSRRPTPLLCVAAMPLLFQRVCMRVRM
jgi:hypothetical protein